MFSKAQHFENSSLRENIIEHLFVGEALRLLWQEGVVGVEILRSEFDAYGYDLVISHGEIVRHVQLKSGLEVKPVSASLLLAEKPSGCIVFVEIDDNLQMSSFRYFGATPGYPLPTIEQLKVTKRTTPNSKLIKPERKMHRTIPVASFKRYGDLGSLLNALIGIDIGRETEQ